MLMICPKHKECSACHSIDHSIPHTPNGDCLSNIAKGLYREKSCPPCIPYKEFKPGDRVRVLGKTTDGGRWESHDFYGVKVGTKTTVRSKGFAPCKHCGEDLYYLEDGKGGAWHAKDLEHIKEEAMKYKATGKLLTVQMIADKASEKEFQSFWDNYLSDCFSLRDIAISEASLLVVTDGLVEYAQKNSSCFMTFLKNGYIEEVKISAYDKWVDDCPHSDEVLPFYKMGLVEWAKRYPGEE